MYISFVKKSVDNFALSTKDANFWLRVQYLLSAYTTNWKVIANDATSISPVKFDQVTPALNREYQIKVNLSSLLTFLLHNDLG